MAEQAYIRRERIACHQQRVPVRRRPRRYLGADIAGGSRPVVDYNRLVPALLKFFPDNARHYIRSGARRVRDDNRDRAVR